MSIARTWRPHPQADARRRSAVALARALVQAPGLLDAHRRSALSLAIWMYTEADGKFNTRYRSRSARGAAPKLLNHEHVVTRKALIAEMIASPERVGEVMASAVACCVLREEHQRLAAVERVDPMLVGWARYRAAGIEVIDQATGEPIEVGEGSTP